MEIGEIGQPLEPAVQPVVEELKLAPEFATTQHLQMVVLLAQDCPLRMLLATTHRHAQLVNEFKKNIYYNFFLIFPILMQVLLSFRLIAVVL